MSLSYAVIAIVVLAVIMVFKTATVVPQQSAYVVEHLGKYSRTLSAGFHILIPFMERIAYRHSLKEIAIDIAEQICITKDNTQLQVDGILYFQVTDPKLASYGSWLNFFMCDALVSGVKQEFGPPPTGVPVTAARCR